MRIFNTWSGDPSKVALLEASLKVIEQEDLINNMMRVGDYLQKGLHDAQVMMIVWLGLFSFLPSSYPFMVHSLASRSGLRVHDPRKH